MVLKNDKVILDDSSLNQNRYSKCICCKNFNKKQWLDNDKRNCSAF